MQAGKIKAVLFIIVFLLVVALICAWVTGGENVENTPNQTPGEQTAPAVPTPNGEISIPTPAATAAPAPAATAAPQQTATPAPVITPMPMPTPVATPEPAATPLPTLSPTPIASGTFSSDTGSALNIRADWSVKITGNNTAEVSVKVYAVSYSLYLSPSTAGLNIALGDQYASVGTPAVSYDGSQQLTTELGSKTFTVDSSAGTVSLPLAVEWHFGGSYGGVELPVIECGGTVAFG